MKREVTKGSYLSVVVKMFVLLIYTYVNCFLANVTGILCCQMRHLLLLRCC
jgi:hypothetical protein